MITEERLLALLDMRFSIRDIASLLHVSLRTIRRRIVQSGLNEEASYSEISGTSFDSITQQFVTTHPTQVRDRSPDT
jgi:transcriptional antiterminator